MTDEVIFMLKMSATDMVVIYNIAKSERLSINEFILKAILEKIESMQNKWLKERGGGVNDS